MNEVSIIINGVRYDAVKCDKYIPCNECDIVEICKERQFLSICNTIMLRGNCRCVIFKKSNKQFVENRINHLINEKG